MSASLMSLLWFVVVLACIPLALLFLKRSGAMAQGLARAVPGVPQVVSSTGLGPQQRLVTVEVGEGAQRRWLVLGVTAQAVNTLHVVENPPVLPATQAAVQPAFAQVLGRVLGAKGGRDGQ